MPPQQHVAEGWEMVDVENITTREILDQHPHSIARTLRGLVRWDNGSWAVTTGTFRQKRLHRMCQPEGHDRFRGTTLHAEKHLVHGVLYHANDRLTTLSGHHLFFHVKELLEFGLHVNGGVDCLLCLSLAFHVYLEGNVD